MARCKQGKRARSRQRLIMHGCRFHHLAAGNQARQARAVQHGRQKPRCHHARRASGASSERHHRSSVWRSRAALHGHQRRSLGGLCRRHASCTRRQGQGAQSWLRCRCGCGYRPSYQVSLRVCAWCCVPSMHRAQAWREARQDACRASLLPRLSPLAGRHLTRHTYIHTYIHHRTYQPRGGETGGANSAGLGTGRGNLCSRRSCPRRAGL